MLSEGTTSTSRGRGRGRNRGKYLRSRGRRGAGRAAEFTSRLLLGEEQEDDDEDESDDNEGQGRYVKREIVDNAVKYAEPEVDPNVEEESDPEVDLSAFLAKQRLNAAEDPITRPLTVPDENDDIDHSLSNLSLSTTGISKPRKNNVQTIEWDAALQKLKEDKEAADAVRDLKTRFRSSQSRPIRSQPRHGVNTMKVEDSRHIETLENEDASHETASKAQMEDFLDDLLS